MKAAFKILFIASLLLSLSTFAYSGSSSVIAKIQTLLQKNMQDGHVTIRKAGSVIIMEYTGIGRNFSMQLPYAQITYNSLYSADNRKDTIWYANINSVDNKNTIIIYQDDQERHIGNVRELFHASADAEEFISLMEALKDGK